MPNSVVVTGEDPSGRPIVSVVAIMRYDISPAGRCIPLGPLRSDLQSEIMEYTGIVYPGKFHPPLLKRDIDCYVWRGHTDIIVQGTVRTEQPVQSLPVDLACAGSQVRFELNVVATGDRWVEHGPAGLRLTSPEPFTEMPMRYDRAYGGFDAHAETKFTDPAELAEMCMMSGQTDERIASDYAYPRNPAGKGYLVDLDGAHGLPWPNLEFPGERLSLSHLAAPMDQWGRRPYPACFAWFSHAWFPRIGFLGVLPVVQDDKIPDAELRMGLFNDGFPDASLFEPVDHAYAQGAHPYLRRHRLVGDEKIRITNMSLDARDFHLHLPASPPKIFIRQFSDSERSAPTVLDCVFVETDLNQVSLIWRGTLPAAQPHLPRGWHQFYEARVVW